MIPLTIQMEIDLSAAAHQRDIAAGFAKLRKKLLPEPAPDPMRAFMYAMNNAAAWGSMMHQNQLAPANGLYPSQLQMANSAWDHLCEAGLLGGVFQPYSRWP
jgi:hypothetical protein